MAADTMFNDNEKSRRHREYGLFLWRVNMATQALYTLYNQAIFAKSTEPEPVSPRDANRSKHWQDTVPIALYGAALCVRNGISEVVRHSCAGAILQISQTMLEQYCIVLGVGRYTSFGESYNGGAQFSRVLWAARNAFVHGAEWAECIANGYKIHLAGVDSINILKSVGVDDPTDANAFNLLRLISGGGDIAAFRKKLIDAAKDAIELPPFAAKREKANVPSKSDGNGGWIVGGIIIGLLYLFLDRPMRGTTSIDYVTGSGDDALSVSIGVDASEVKSSYALFDALRKVAIEALPAELSSKYREYKELEDTFSAAVNEIAAWDQERDDFASQLLFVCDLAQRWHSQNMALPDPISEYISSKLGGASSAEGIHSVLADLARRAGFTPKPYSVNVIQIASPKIEPSPDFFKSD